MGVNLDDRKIDFMLIEEPMLFKGKDAKKQVKKLEEIKGEKEKAARRRERKSEQVKDKPRDKSAVKPTTAKHEGKSKRSKSGTPKSGAPKRGRKKR